jgi:hypothetical protein
MTALGLPRWLLLLGVVLIPVKPAIEPARPELGPPALDVALEVQALRTVYLLRATPEQMKQLQKMAKDLAAPDRDRQRPRVSGDYRRVLADLRDALVADDDDRVERLEDRLADLTDAEDPQLDDEVKVTAAARRLVPEALRLFRPAQVAGLIASLSDEVGDPQERLADALEQARSVKSGEWEEARGEMADDLGWLLGGLDASRAKAVRSEVTALLNKARGLSDEEFESRREELEQEARRVGADVPPTEVLKHAVERALARLLSNPRLGVALQARLK